MPEALTETERLLIQAQDIANRRLQDATERAVLDIFDELRAERDRMAWATDGRESTTAH
ncbi:hypothetical protein [Achromobacter aegrifaciens]|uniref:hypothetical protein n=1 Tax=Achromobacter aegrifaciens TaxID=1287736 RepID=UPI0028A7A9FB|nr:hypothetical protein [Achromobacter aegrifaciens]